MAGAEINVPKYVRTVHPYIMLASSCKTGGVGAWLQFVSG